MVMKMKMIQHDKNSRNSGNEEGCNGDIHDYDDNDDDYYYYYVDLDDDDD